MAQARRKAASEVRQPASGATHGPASTGIDAKRVQRRPTRRKSPVQESAPRAQHSLDHALRDLLHVVGSPDADVLTAEALQHWGVEAAAAFASVGLVLREGLPDEIPCPECGDGTMVRVAREGAAARVVVAMCWGGGEPHRVRTAIDDTRLWRLSLSGVARCVSRALCARGTPEVVDPERLIAVGAIEYRGSVHDCFLARGLWWPDATSRICSAEAIKSSPRPFVIALDRTGPSSIWTDAKPVVVRLPSIVSWGLGGITVDLGAVPTQSATPSVASGAADWITVTAAAEMLVGVRSGLSLERARARVSRHAGMPQATRPFVTNGEDRVARRIDRHTFSTWLMSQRDVELDEADGWAQGG